MDRESLTKQMKSLKAKSKAARKEGKKDLARTFRAGSERLNRQLKALTIFEKHQPKPKTGAAEGAPSA